MKTMDAISELLMKADLTALVETGRELAAEVTLTPLLQRVLERATQLFKPQASYK
jgi:hypothetical protein